MNIEAIVLAGGLGTRLREVVSDIPKPMVLVNNQPFLNYILNLLEQYNIRTVILAIGYLHEKIERYYGNSYRNMKLVYSIENEPLGTGGGIKLALEKATTRDVLILNGDTFFDVNLSQMLARYQQLQPDMIMALKPMKDIWRYGVVKVKDNRVVSFEDRKQVPYGYINGGVYIARNSLFDSYPLPAKFSFEADFLKKFVSSLNIAAFISDTFFIDIGIPEDLNKAQIEMKKFK